MALMAVNKEQAEAFNTIMEGLNLIITGQACTGKTYPLKSVYHDLKFIEKKCTSALHNWNRFSTVHRSRCLNYSQVCFCMTYKLTFTKLEQVHA